jgi:hypothetical protein
MSMSGSIAPDPPAREVTLGGYLRLGLIIAIGFIWTTEGARGLAGTRGRGSGEPLYCPDCGALGRKLGGALYKCTGPEEHVFNAAEGKRKK